MWRIILPSFGFLGVIFYQMSGGSDYAPKDNSIQRQMTLSTIFPSPDPVVPAKTSEEVQVVARSEGGITAPVQDSTGQVQVTLAAYDGDTTSAITTDGATSLTVPTVAVDADKVSDLVNPEVLVLEEDDSADIRQVTGNSVNMRRGPGTKFSKVGKLNKGDEIEIISDPGRGWLRVKVVETQEMGWLADFLVTAAR